MRKLITVMLLLASTSAMAAFESKMSVAEIRLEIAAQRVVEGRSLDSIIKSAMAVGIKPKLLSELLQEQGFRKDAIVAAFILNGGDPAALLESTASGPASTIEGFKFTPVPTLSGGGKYSVSKS